MAAGSCGPSGPYVRYDGINFGRAPKPVEAMEVYKLDGLINQDEYQQKRQQILNDI